MLAQALQTRLEARRHFAHVADDVALLVDLQRLQRDRRRHRVAAVGVARAVGAVLAALLDEGLIDRIGDHDGRDGQIRRRELLRAGDDVGLDAIGLGAPHVAGASEPADDLVGHHQHVVAFEHLLHLLEIGRRRGDHAARAHDGLGHEGGDRIGPLGLDELVQAVRQAAGELFLGLSVSSVTVV